MYPMPAYYERLEDDSFNKKTCIKICQISCCLSCVCIIYSLFFIKLIEYEDNINITIN
jgi:hypothetical protein